MGVFRVVVVLLVR